MYLYLVKFEGDHEDRMVVNDYKDVALVADRASHAFQGNITEVVYHGSVVDLSDDDF